MMNIPKLKIAEFGDFTASYDIYQKATLNNGLEIKPALHCKFIMSKITLYKFDNFVYLVCSVKKIFRYEGRSVQSESLELHLTFDDIKIFFELDIEELLYLADLSHIVRKETPAWYKSQYNVLKP